MDFSVGGVYIMPDCQHHFILPSADKKHGGVVLGRCKLCGATRDHKLVEKDNKAWRKKITMPKLVSKTQSSAQVVLPPGGSLTKP